MTYFLHILDGILIAYLAMLPPGMLNMTALKIRIDFGRNESVKFSVAAAIIVLIQAGIALLFADYFSLNPKIIIFLEKAGVFVLFSLAIFFYFLSKKAVKTEEEKSSSGNFFMKGVVMSTLNMLAIPFYIAISIFLTSKGFLIIEQPYIILFISGTFIGALLLFFTYIYFAKIIMNKVSFIARNINLILSGVFVVLGLITLIRLLN